MKTIRSLILLTACSLNLSNLSAQQDAPSATTEAIPVFPEQVAFDFNFAGGTLTEFADLVEKSNKGLKIMVPAAFAEVEVPNMHFKGVNFTDLHELVSAATRMTDSRIQFEHIGQGRWVAQASIKEERRDLAIYPAAGLIKGRSVKDLMAVIERAFMVADLKPVPQFHLHEETQVLMASLTRSEEEIVTRLFDVLERPTVDDEAALDAKRETVNREIAMLRKELMVKNTHLLELQNQSAKVAEKGGKLIQPEVEVRMMRNEIDLIERGILGYMELLNRLRAKELGLENDLPPAQTSEPAQRSPQEGLIRR